MNDCISRKDLKQYCEKAADTCREICEKIFDKIDDNKAVNQDFSALAYFERKELMYRYEIPGIIDCFAEETDGGEA